MKNNISGRARPYQNLHSPSIAGYLVVLSVFCCACGSKMAERRKSAAKQRAKRRGKNQVVEESKVAEEIVLQCMSGEVSGKQQKYSCIGAQE